MTSRTCYFEIEPNDTLFFRDARPMQAGAGSGGHGARWPIPSVIHEGLRTALLIQSGSELPKGDQRERGHHHPGTRGERRIVTRDFESLRVIGPLPLRDEKLFLPLPADLTTVAAASGRRPKAATRVTTAAPVLNAPGSANFPASWLHPVAACGEPIKESLPGWVDATTYGSLLSLPVEKEVEIPLQPGLWETEHRTGVAIDPATRGAKKGQFYTSEQMRFIGNTRIWFSATLTGPDREWELLHSFQGDRFLLGGESRMARLEPSQDLLAGLVNGPPSITPFQGPTLEGDRADIFGVKWVLATPAVFLGGWRPNWIAEKDEKTTGRRIHGGQVLLRKGDTERRPGEERRSWRERIRELEPIRARLVAVCNAKPLAFSGWDLGTGGPKPTLLAVPAGSVYYFIADSRKDADALIDNLHGRTRSDRLGEKGMGLGFCGSWAPLDWPGRA